ncbi:hypothetical protein LSAT2_003149 [Lamellibrachia satsuma]|nr:hypothetical protein LSAT2_003149 [Lamellibrachia satsuma]
MIIMISLSSLKKWKSSDARQIQLTNSIISSIATDLLPLSLVDSKQFRSLLHTAEPAFMMPSRKHLSTQLLPQRAASVRSDLKNILQRAQDMELTIELWSSRDMRAFIDITGHFILDFTMRGIMLAFYRVRGSHTAENVHLMYEETVACFDLAGKVSAIVTDNGSNMVKAFTLPGMENMAVDVDETHDSNLTWVQLTDDLEFLVPQQVPCFAHTLQLVVKDGLQHAGQVKSIIDKVAKLVAYVRKSTTASEILEGHQNKMLRSIIRIPEDVLHKLDCTSKLSSYEMKLIGELCKILQPFEEVTDRVQGQAIVTCVRGLRHTLVELRKTYNKLVTTLQASLKKLLLKYDEMPYFKLAAAFDPRFKMDWCTEDEVAVVHVLLRSTVTPAPPHTTTRSDEPPPTKRSKLFTFMSDRSVQMPPVTISPTNDELNMYLNQPCESEDSAPLMFWQNCAVQFPCKYLAMPTSSAPVERLFSVAGKVFRPERCCLSDWRFEQLMMIHCNNARS